MKMSLVPTAPICYRRCMKFTAGIALFVALTLSLSLDASGKRAQRTKRNPYPLVENADLAIATKDIRFVTQHPSFKAESRRLNELKTRLKGRQSEVARLSKEMEKIFSRRDTGKKTFEERSELETQAEKTKRTISGKTKEILSLKASIRGLEEGGLELSKQYEQLKREIELSQQQQSSSPTLKPISKNTKATTQRRLVKRFAETEHRLNEHQRKDYRAVLDLLTESGESLDQQIIQVITREPNWILSYQLEHVTEKNKKTTKTTSYPTIYIRSKHFEASLRQGGTIETGAFNGVRRVGSVAYSTTHLNGRKTIEILRRGRPSRTETRLKNLNAATRQLKSTIKFGLSIAPFKTKHLKTENDIAFFEVFNGPSGPWIAQVFMGKGKSSHERVVFNKK